MARIAQLIGAAALTVSLTGCVTQEKYSAMKLERDSLKATLDNTSSELKAAQAQAGSYNDQLQRILSSGGNLQALVANLTQQNASLQAQYDDLNKQYLAMLNNPRGGGQALPAELSNTLSAFANQNPDLVEFDAARGTVKFKSDVTFASGDAAVQPKAKEAIAKFATILNSASAAGYELMVAGHTDSSRVSSPETIKKGHPDNWYLSAHRAIAVANELRGDSVNAQRLAVVGYADQRPIASNTTTAGMAQNRRVEVLILPTTIKSTANVAARETTAVAKPKMINKDSSGIPSTPIRSVEVPLNK